MYIIDIVQNLGEVISKNLNNLNKEVEKINLILSNMLNEKNS